MRNEKKMNDKGFTLVELIVVLVILAILAAILVPALLGYIDKAKGQQIVLNAKSCLTAAQAELSSVYAKDKSAEDLADYAESIIKTADVPCDELKIGVAKKDGIAVDDTSEHINYTIAYVYYKEGDNVIVFDGTAWDDSLSESAITTKEGDFNIILEYSASSNGDDSGN